MEIFKQACGIDMAKDSFVVRYGVSDKEQEYQITEARGFKNNNKGFNSLLKWIKKTQKDKTMPVWFIIEATGVYYENLAYFLYQSGCNVSVLLPNKAKNHSKTLSNKSKTDAIDAYSLTVYGLEKKHEKWEPPKPIYKKLKTLTRERESIVELRTLLKNQLHAEKHTHDPSKGAIRRLITAIRLYDKQVDQIEKEIKELLKTDAKLEAKVAKMETIKGVGLITVVTHIAETNGYELIRNKRQLASYAGLDIVLNESGNRLGKSRISKKGNSHLRSSVYLPALSAIKYMPEINNLYKRILTRTGIKRKGIIAVARKLLILIYTLWKKDQEYIPNYKMA